MKFNLGLISLSILLASCSNLIVEQEDLPDVNAIAPTTIITQLPVINIKADQCRFDKMVEIYYNKIIVEGELTTHNVLGSIQVIDQKIKFEIRGGSSVGASFPLKSIGVDFEEPLNSKSLGFKTDNILPGHYLDYLTTTRFRSSGNDFGITMIKDLAYSRFAVQNRLNLELMYGIPVQVFVNNKYYGLMNARTESNLAGMAALLQADSSQMVLLKVKDETENLKFDEGNRLAGEALLKAIELEDAQAIWNNVDVGNFIDYIIYQDYIGNIDWGNNVKAFNPGNGKFRFIIYDTDLAGNATVIPLLPKLEFVSADLGKIYRGLQENEGFKAQLENRKKALYQGFAVSDFNKIVDELARTIENDIPYLIAKYNRPESTLHWKMEIDKMKLDFKNRDHYIRNKYHLN